MDELTDKYEENIIKQMCQLRIAFYMSYLKVGKSEDVQELLYKWTSDTAENLYKEYEILLMLYRGKKEVVDYKNLLRNLLAVIHRDGGHYTCDHGVVKATKDAMVIVANAIVK